MNELKNILFIDIETVSCVSSYERLEDRFKPLWEIKAKYIEDQTKSFEEKFFDKAAIYAEFGKIITIGMGFFYSNESGDLCFKTKTIAGHDEKALLLEFADLLRIKYNYRSHRLCAHNGKEFDYPYLCRRMIIQGIDIPPILQLSSKKPWEVPHYDTLEMWKFGDKKSYTSLELLAAVLGVPTSKDGIDGSMVNHTYYNLKDLDKISAYCKRDVVVMAKIFLKLTTSRMELKEEHVYYS